MISSCSPSGAPPVPYLEEVIMIMPPELEEDFRVRGHAIVRAWLRGDVEGLVSLTGDDADELLPMVVQILMDALLQVVSRETVEQLAEWFAKRFAA
jgi:hypothetical protein